MRTSTENSNDLSDSFKRSAVQTSQFVMRSPFAARFSLTFVLYLLILGSVLPGTMLGQVQVDKKIKKETDQIVLKCSQNMDRIDTITQWDEIKEVESWGTTQDGNLTLFYKDHRIEKIQLSFEKSYSKIDLVYYLLNGQLSAHQQNTLIYNREIGYDSLQMKKNGDVEVHDLKKSRKTTISGYYLNGIQYKVDLADGSENYGRTTKSSLIREFERIVEHLKKDGIPIPAERPASEVESGN